MTDNLFKNCDSLEEALGLAGGAWSVCWEKMEDTGIFQSDRAKVILDDLVDWINTNTDIVDPARSKGEKIVSECIQAGEPFFVFRARDIFTVMVLRKYAQLVDDFGPNDFDFSEGVHDHIDKTRNWQRANPTRVKYPD